MGSLSYTVAEDDQIIFEVITSAAPFEDAQVVRPFYNANAQDVVGGDSHFKKNTLFKETRHKIGFEGECLHTHTSVTLSNGEILAYMAQLDSNSVMIGDSPTSLFKVSPTRFEGDTSTPSLIQWNTDRDSYWLYTNGSFVTDELQGTFNFSNRSSRSVYMSRKGPGSWKQSFSRTNIECSEDNSHLSFDYEEKHFISEDQPFYSDYVGSKGYHEVPGGVEYKHHSKIEISDPRVFFIGVSLKEFRKARKALTKELKDFINSNPQLSRKVFFMPVEESFLDDLYESLGIPSMNSVATILELLGSIRNAKSVTSLFKNIKKNGGIRKTLVKEGSDILKDKKLSTASNLYLTKKYVYDTTRMDIDDFFEKLSTRLGQLPSPVQHFRWTKTLEMDSESVHCIRLAYQPYEYSKAELYGFDLPLEATWDCLPYSFIIDWFCSFGDSLESIDKVGALEKVKVISCTESYRVSTYRQHEVNVHGVTVHFSTLSVSYNREVTDHLPPVYPRSPKLSNPFHHIIDGAALVFARR